MDTLSGVLQYVAQTGQRRPRSQSLFGQRDLADPIRFSDDEDGLTAAGVSDTLSKDACPHILLVTGTDTQTSKPTVFGAYLPQESEVLLCTFSSSFGRAFDWFDIVVLRRQ